MSLTLTIPDDVADAMRLPRPEAERRLRLELAISLYAQQILGLGTAAKLAELNRWEFNDVLARRGISMHYSEEDLRHDAAYANGHQ